MPFNEFKPTGVTRASQPDAGGGNVKTVPVLAIVKSNIDPIRQGRLQVYIVDPSSSTDPDDSDAWVTVSYMSPFFGRTNSNSSSDGFGTFKNNPSSYGEWHSPPDIGTTVVCIFINGDMNYGYYIGCVPEPESLQMVPAIGSTDNVIPNSSEAESFGGALKLPVTNINPNNSGIADSATYLSAPKPVHSYSSAIMFQQGLLRDPIRGPISSSSQRETPSRVGWGVSTPGRPIYEGGFDDVNIVDNLTPDKASQLKVISRRGGHSIVMDDGDLIGRDQLVRIRTALGHQILMSDDGQTLFIIHSNGQSYIELGKEGTIDMYSTNSVNIRTQGDLNLHADNNININATKNLNIHAENFNLNSDKEFNQKVGTNYKFFAAGQYTTKVSKQMSFMSGGDASFASSALTYVNGKKINLNTGSTSLNPQEVKPIPLIAHTDSLYDNVKGWAAVPGKLQSIVSRAPAHTPWANANQGVDVKINMNSDSALATRPSPSVNSINELAANAVTDPATSATIATMPAIGQISESLNTNATSSVIAAVAKDAATGPLQNAVTGGASIITQGGQKVLAIGPFALTPDMLEAAGILKPGAASLVKSQIDAGYTIQDALPDVVFAGKPGAENLNQLIANPNLQAQSVAQNMSTVQQALTNLGIITGTESPTQISGMLVSGLTLGVTPTVNVLQQNTNSDLSGVLPATFSQATRDLTSSQSVLLENTTKLPIASGDVLQKIGAGNFATDLSESVTGGFGGITNAVSAITKNINSSGTIDNTRGPSAAAFSAITNSFAPLKANSPQNLSEIMIKKRESTNEISNQLTQTSTSVLNNSVTTDLPTNVQTLLNQSIVGVPTNNINVENAINSVVDSNTNPAGPLPNRLSAAGSVINKTLTTTLNESSKTDNLGSLAGARTLLTSATSSLGSLTQAASSVSGGIASNSSLLASGISLLPGGQSTIAAVTNGLDTISNIPGATSLSRLVTNVATNLQNNLPNPAQLLSQAGSLTNLVSAGLPAGSMSQLISAISTLSSGSSLQVKMPSVSVNTFNRAAITQQISNVLSDKGIPLPNFLGEVPASAKVGYQASVDKAKAIAQANDELNKQTQKTLAARQAYLTAKNTLPAGDPKIETLKQQWYSSINSPEIQAIRNRLAQLRAS